MVISCHVAVIGAGLAGLAAADHLKSQGYDVKVFEAENRIGGRVFTHHPSNENHLELGAFSFGDGEQPLWNYIQRFALPVIKQTEMDRTFWFKNWTGTMSEKGIFLEGHEQEIPLSKLLSTLCQKLENITEDMPLSQALTSIGASSEAIEWLQANTIIGLLGKGFETISIKSALAFLKQYDDCTFFYAIKGGNDLLPQAFAKELKENILLNHPVTKIEQCKDRCIIKGDAFQVEAKRVIFTIPLSKMKLIEINPPLSIEKQTAIQNTPYTPCARISIIAPPTIFASSPRGGVFLISELGWFREQSIFQNDPLKKTVMNISLAGTQAEKVALSLKEWKLSIDTALSKINPRWTSAQAEYHSHVWNEGYSYFPAHMNQLQDSLRKCEGRLHFAGEHTSPKYSSMNGAIESGIRAANEIISLKEI